MQPVVLVMPGETGAAGHERVVAVADGVGGDVAQALRRSGGRLLRHPDGLIAADEDQLRAVDVVRLEQDTIPDWASRSRWKGRSRHVVRRAAGSGARAGCGSAAIAVREDGVTVTLPEPWAIGAVLGDDLKVEVRAEVELPHETFAAEALIADSRTSDGNSAGGEIVGRRLADHGVEADAFYSELAGVKSLASGKEAGVGIRSCSEIYIAISRTEKGGGVSRTIVPAVAHHLEAELVVAHLAEDVAITHRNEVVELIDASVPGERQNSLFRKKIVEFELAQLHVKPRAAPEVVKSSHDGFKVKGSSRVGRRKEEERKVLF